MSRSRGASLGRASSGFAGRGAASALRGAVSGHLWTVVPTFKSLARPPTEPPSVPWTTTVDDPTWGAVKLTGKWSELQQSDTVLVVVHGLGGDADSAYVVHAAAAARSAGLSCLRVSMRGADLLGADVYHAGLYQDLLGVLGSAELRRFSRALLLGYSLGGHLCLHAAVRGGDPRLRAAAAVCPPLDLAAVQQALDAPSRWPYRHHVLTSLKQAYRAVARRRDVPTPVKQVERISTIRQFDRLVIVPRFGFRDVDDYYARASVGPLLGELGVPSLLVSSTRDPMVPRYTATPWLPRASHRLEAHELDAGGHLYFPASAHLGLAAPRGVEPQIVAWLAARCG
ncbi:MAG: hypothetical protein JRI23_15225 [Deltaproteobacteria bacterium]|jgi:predicted alpha/beta-fold hydrolase|nr:hypothetical protein [Deltaproteobacteria bacterium]MBW2533100.1 hypothetical protein [Deltaproteobacteria bacterium]